MSMAEKLETFSERKMELERELQEISVSKRESNNAALAELEAALLAELDTVQQKIEQINTYIDRCDDVSRNEEDNS